jgi:hypothetical protein
MLKITFKPSETDIRDYKITKLFQIKSSLLLIHHAKETKEAKSQKGRERRT